MANKLGKLFLTLKIAIYRCWWDIATVSGSFKAKQPVLLTGKGRVVFGDKVTLGYKPSPYLYSSYIHIEARTEAATITFGNNVMINNDCAFISDGAGIHIGDNALFGTRVEIYDTDFHELDPARRHISPTPVAVHIGNNVFIGSNSIVLKGVTIGDDCVVASHSIVTRDVPRGCVVAGNPAKVVREITPQ